MIRKYAGMAIAMLMSLCVCAAPAAAQDTVARGLAIQAKVAAARLSIPQSTTIANRNGLLGGSAATNVAGGTVAAATYRNWFMTPAGYSTSDPVSCWANWSWTSSGEIVGANSITVKVALETIAGVSFPAFFSGQSTAVVAPGATVCTDPLSIQFPPNSFGWWRVYVTNNGNASGTWPVGRQMTNLGYESSTYGTTAADLTASTGQIAGSSNSGSGAYSFGPVSITGRPSKYAPVFCSYNDSIGEGVGDNANTGYYGWIERALTNNYAWTKMGRAGYRAQFLASQASRALTMCAGKANVAIDAMGVNDIYAGGVTLGAIQALKLIEWGYFSNRQIRVYQTTVTPYTTSTDGYTTLANQSIYTPAQNTVRVGFNTWLRCGAPILSGAAVACGTSGAVTAGQAGHPLNGGVIDNAAITESALDSGLWRVAARQVTDANITSGTNTLTSATASFTAADIGYVVYLTNGTNTFSAAIDSVTNGTTAVLHSQATSTFAGATLKIGGCTGDGLHPSGACHTLMATNLQNLISAGSIGPISSGYDLPKLPANDDTRQALAA